MTVTQLLDFQVYNEALRFSLHIDLQQMYDWGFKKITDLPQRTEQPIPQEALEDPTEIVSYLVNRKADIRIKLFGAVNGGYDPKWMDMNAHYCALIDLIRENLEQYQLKAPLNGK